MADDQVATRLEEAMKEKVERIADDLQAAARPMFVEMAWKIALIKAGINQ